MVSVKSKMLAKKNSKPPRAKLKIDSWLLKHPKREKTFHEYIEAFAEERSTDFGFMDLHKLLVDEWPDVSEPDGFRYGALRKWCKERRPELFPWLKNTRE